MSWCNQTVFHGCLVTLGCEVVITTFLTQGRPTIIIFPDEQSNLVQILAFIFTFYSCTYLKCVHVFPCFCYHILSVKTKKKEQDFDLKNPITAESTYCKLDLGPSHPPQQKVLETWKSKGRQQWQRQSHFCVLILYLIIATVRSLNSSHEVLGRTDSRLLGFRIKALFDNSYIYFSDNLMNTVYPSK